MGAGDGGRGSEQLDLTVPSPPTRLASVIHVTGSVGRCRIMIIVVLIVIAEHIDCAGAGHTPRAGLPGGSRAAISPFARAVKPDSTARAGRRAEEGGGCACLRLFIRKLPAVAFGFILGLAQRVLLAEA